MWIIKALKKKSAELTHNNRIEIYMLNNGNEKYFQSRDVLSICKQDNLFLITFFTYTVRETNNNILFPS